MDLMVKNGTVVPATDTYRADIRVAGEKIVQIGDDLEADAGTRVVYATDKYVLPAGIDPHTHLASPGQGTTTADDYLTGTIAAACGGTTSIVNFAFQGKGDSLDVSLGRHVQSAANKASIDYGFHAMISALTNPLPAALAS